MPKKVLSTQTEFAHGARQKSGRHPASLEKSKSRMRTGKDLILATKPYAHDSSARSWAHLLSTAFLLAGALAGTLWNLHLAGRIGCSLLAGLLYLRFFVIYHDQ